MHKRAFTEDQEEPTKISGGGAHRALTLEPPVRPHERKALRAEGAGASESNSCDVRTDGIEAVRRSAQTSSSFRPSSAPTPSPIKPRGILSTGQNSGPPVSRNTIAARRNRTSGAMKPPIAAPNAAYKNLERRPGFVLGDCSGEGDCICRRTVSAAARASGNQKHAGRNPGVS